MILYYFNLYLLALYLVFTQIYYCNYSEKFKYKCPIYFLPYGVTNEKSDFY